MRNEDGVSTAGLYMGLSKASYSWRTANVWETPAKKDDQDDEDDEDEDEDDDDDDGDDDDAVAAGGGGGGTFSLLALEEMREGHRLVSRHGYGSLLSEFTGVSERDCIVRHSGKHQSSDRRGNSRGPVCIHLAQ